MPLFLWLGRAGFSCLCPVAFLGCGLFSALSMEYMRQNESPWSSLPSHSLSSKVPRCLSSLYLSKSSYFHLTYNVQGFYFSLEGWLEKSMSIPSSQKHPRDITLFLKKIKDIKKITVGKYCFTKPLIHRYRSIWTRVHNIKSDSYHSMVKVPCAIHLSLSI